MRFRVQYRDGRGDWADVEDADSGWRAVGLAKGAPVESGWSFTFAHPAKPVMLRGVVRFRVRRGDTLPRHAEVATEAGPSLQRGRRSGRLLGRHLRARQLSEQPRVVGDDPGDAEPLEPADPRRLVDRPHVELAARLAHGAHEPR